MGKSLVWLSIVNLGVDEFEVSLDSLRESRRLKIGIHTEAHFFNVSHENLFPVMVEVEREREVCDSFGEHLEVFSSH